MNTEKKSSETTKGIPGVRSEGVFIYRDYNTKVTGLNNLLSCLAGGIYSTAAKKDEQALIVMRANTRRPLYIIKVVNNDGIFDTPAAFNRWVSLEDAKNIVADMNKRLFRNDPAKIYNKALFSEVAKADWFSSYENIILSTTNA